MRMERILSWVGFLGLGFALAVWWFASGRTEQSPKHDANSSVGTSNGVSARTSDAQVLRMIDWGIMLDGFRIRNVRVATMSKPQIGLARPFRVVAFDVESTGNFAGGMYRVRFYDGEGIEIPPVPDKDGILRPRFFDLIDLEPDFALQEPFRWTPGVRSRGWFMFPDGWDKPDMPRVGKIVVCGI